MNKKIIFAAIAFMSVIAVNAQTPAGAPGQPILNSAPVQDKPTLNNVANENPNQAAFKFKEEEFTFGTIKQGESVTHEFEFTNTGKEPLIISNASGSCGCTVPVWPKEPIVPGAKGTIKVTFNSAGKMGMQDKTVTLQSNAAQSPMILHLKGDVDKADDEKVATPESEKK